MSEGDDRAAVPDDLAPAHCDAGLDGDLDAVLGKHLAAVGLMLKLNTDLSIR